MGWLYKYMYLDTDVVGGKNMGDDIRQICPVCNHQAKVTDYPGFFALHIKCTICGEFILENDIFDSTQKTRMSLNEKACLYYYLTQNNTKVNQKFIPHFHNNQNWGDEESVEDNKRKVIALSSVVNLFPNTIDLKINMTLVNLASILKYIGKSFEINRCGGDERYYHIFFVDDQFGEDSCAQQLYGMLAILKGLGFIEMVGVPAGGVDKYRLTAHGWMAVAEYLNKNKMVKQGFIAMWFDDCMKKAKANIIQAIEDCGYIPLSIDLKEHNNQIVPEIFHEIKRSQFMVADLTGQRNGVYFEAGFGKALDKEVIFTCREDQKEKPHFDVAQYNTIFWKDENDLYHKLMDRIGATVGNLKKV